MRATFLTIINKTYLTLISIISIAIFLRLYHLNWGGIWYDEAFSLLIANHLKEIFKNLSMIAFLPEFPFFSFILNVWRYFFGNQEIILRLLPVCFGVGSIFFTFLIGKELFNKSIGLLSAFILSISPLHVYYSQEIRSYMVGTFFSLCSIYFFIRIIKEKSNFLTWINYVVFSVLCCYCYYSFCFILVIENLYLLINPKRYRKLLKIWTIFQLVIFFLFLPLIYYYAKFIPLAKEGGAVAWILKTPNIFVTLFQACKVLIFGYNSDEWNYNVGIIFLLILLFFLRPNSYKKPILLVFLWMFVPILLLWTLSLFNSLFLIRSLLYVVPPFSIFIAFLLKNLNRFLMPALLLITTLYAIPLNNYYNNIYPTSEHSINWGVHPRKETRAAANYIMKKSNRGDIIIHSNIATFAPFYFYHQEKLEEKMLDIMDPIWSRHYNFLKKVPNKTAFLNSVISSDALINNYNKVWLVFSSWGLKYDEYSIEIKQLIDSNFQMKEFKSFIGLEVYFYTK